MAKGKKGAKEGGAAKKPNGDSSSVPGAIAGLLRSMHRAVTVVKMAAARHADLGAAHATALAALDEHAAAAESDPELAHLLDLFRARLDLLRGGNSIDSWATAKAHIYQHCRMETAQQPYSLQALKLWVHHSRNAIHGTGIIANTLRDWVEGPFERWESCAWLSPADEVTGDKEDKAVASLGTRKDKERVLITDLIAEYKKAQDKLSGNLFYQKASGVAEDILMAANKQEDQLQAKGLHQGCAVSHTAHAAHACGPCVHAAIRACAMHAMHCAWHMPSKMHGATELAPTLLHAAPRLSVLGRGRQAWRGQR
jgi:hypothetical protein